MNPEARDAADGRRLECHVATGRHALHQSVVLFSRLDPPTHAFVCARRRSNPIDRRCIFRVERMYHDDVSRSFRGTHQSLVFPVVPAWILIAYVEGNPESIVKCTI